MTLDINQLTALAPDQPSLQAANTLLQPAKWPTRALGDGLVWGECQGSGANPYRTVFDPQERPRGSWISQPFATKPGTGRFTLVPLPSARRRRDPDCPVAW
jgi:hypothetical protein